MTVRKTAGALVTAAGDRRVTAVGRVLRKLKIDEIPGLWCVVRGDLALVGARPEVPRYVDLDDPLWARILQARPGLTDPTTIYLRNEEELMAAAGGDVEQVYRSVLLPYKLKSWLRYLERRDALSDLRVLAQTVHAALRPDRYPPPTLDALLSA
tara:strand:- start:280 stop:741 length:462 start_codon:yes stop_codon:yes gene_type:complete